MTDLEISKALALAIGWPRADVVLGRTLVYSGGKHDRVRVGASWMRGYRVFDYRDWDVIGPIAVKYNSFPYAHRGGKGMLDGKWVVWPNTIKDTPQKAIALAVIRAQP